jgi:hypothetical protein
MTMSMAPGAALRIFDAFWQALDRYYAFFELRGEGSRKGQRRGGASGGDATIR